MNTKKDVRPIKNLGSCKTLLTYLKNDGNFNTRDYVIFKLGMSCVLRISDLIHLRYSDVFTETGRVKKNLQITEIKTGKEKNMPLKHVQADLIEYKRALDKFMDNLPDKYLRPLKSTEMETVGTGKNKREIKKNQRWLFPSTQHPTQHISVNTFYRVMKLAQDSTGIQHLGTHTPRKTGAYIMYRGNFDDVLKAHNMQPRNDIALAMRVLNHSSESATLHYLGLEQENLEKMITNTSAFNITIEVK